MIKVKRVAGKLFGFMLLWLASSVQLSLADGAGVLLYTEIDKEQYVLLADHLKVSQVQRGWSTLGGTIKKNETDLEAAIREVDEESNGVFDVKQLKELVNPQIKTITPGFTIYFAQVKYLPPVLFDSKNSNNTIEHGERGPYTWVPWSEIKKAGEKYEQLNCQKDKARIDVKAEFLPKEYQTSWYFSAFLSTIKYIVKTKDVPLKST